VLTVAVLRIAVAQCKWRKHLLCAVLENTNAVVVCWIRAMADTGTIRTNADGKPPRAQTADSESRKTRNDMQTVGGDGDDDRAASRHSSGISVSDGEHRRDARKTINRSSSVSAIELDHDAPLRLVVVSSKIRNSSVMQSAVLPNVVFVQYKYESATTDSCLGKFSFNSTARGD